LLEWSRDLLIFFKYGKLLKLILEEKVI
jgi:hypothetical protein